MKKRIASLFLTFVIVFETGTSAFAARTDIAASINAAIPLAEIIPATDSGKSPVGTSAPALVSVAVTSLPDKLDYLCTDTAVDPAGGVLSLVYSDGTEVETELTEAQLSALDGMVGEVSVSITREGFTTGLSVNAAFSFNEGDILEDAPQSLLYACKNCGDTKTEHWPPLIFPAAYEEPLRSCRHG